MVDFVLSASKPACTMRNTLIHIALDIIYIYMYIYIIMHIYIYNIQEFASHAGLHTDTGF